jgi:hypothetical protein
MANLKRVLVSLAGALLMAGVAVAPASSLELPPLPTLNGLPIPSLPTDLLVPKFIGGPVDPHPIEHSAVPQNPWVAPNGRSSMHNDPYSSDAYAVTGPLGRSLTVRSRAYGIRECATVSFDAKGRLVALCGGLEGFRMMLIEPNTLKVLAELNMPARDLRSFNNPFTDLCGGTYFFLTRDDKAVAVTTTNEVWEVSTTDQSAAKNVALKKTASWALGSHLAGGDCLVALTADWDGRVWFFSQGGTVGTLDRGTGAVKTITLGNGETVVNSVSADETGGVYAVSTHAMYRFDADGSGAPHVSWRQAYDRGSTQKPGQLSQGSGTSPTLIGDRWVAITDNADPRMNVLVYDRRTGVSDRLHCTVPVFKDGASATENSLTAAGDSVLVENNYGYAGFQSTLLGKSTTPGFARVLIEGNGCRLAWSNDTVIAPTSVPKASLGSGLVYAYTKPVRKDALDAWYFTAIDIRTGTVAWSRLTGTGIHWNNHYASIYLGPGGAAYISTLIGMVRVSDG